MCSDVVKKRVRVIFEDSFAQNGSRSKVGYILEKDSEFLTIQTDNRIEMIPIIKIIRIEVISYEN
jgi:hypothetical protein